MSTFQLGDASWMFLYNRMAPKLNEEEAVNQLGGCYDSATFKKAFGKLCPVGGRTEVVLYV